MNVLIVEDESLAADKLRKMLLTYDSTIKILDVLTSIKDSVKWFEKNRSPDLLLLDISIDDGLCFEIFQQVEITCPVIFTTAYDNYAIKAFKVHSIDYLLKPIQYEKLASSLLKLENLNATYGHRVSDSDVKSVLNVLKARETQFKSRFLVKAGAKIRTVKATEISYVYTERKLNLLITKDGQRFPIDYSLDELRQVLDPSLFFRANRQLIIHIDAITQIHSYSKGRVKLELSPPLKTDIIISSEKTPVFKSWLDN